jgi:hypothetical protein
MKKSLIIILSIAVSIIMSSCSTHADLYRHTDYFVEQLSTVYVSYGLAGLKYKRFTDDGKYGIFPTGRLINVRIESPYATTKDYENLRKDLERYYRGNPNVNKVYICQGGTIMIDCRN